MADMRTHRLLEKVACGEKITKNQAIGLAHDGLTTTHPDGRPTLTAEGMRTINKVRRPQ